MCCRAPALASPWDLFIVHAKVWKEVNCTEVLPQEMRKSEVKPELQTGGFLSFPALRNALEEPLSALLLTSAPGIKVDGSAAAAAVGESLMDLLLHLRDRNGVAEEKTHK